MGWIAAAAFVCWSFARIFGGYPRPGRAHAHLARREAAFLSAAADAMFPAGGAIEASGAEADLPGYVDRLLAVSQPRIRTLMRALFFLVEHATLFFPAPGGLSGLRRFSSLGSEQRAAVLRSWGASRLYARQLVFTSLRAILTLGYLAHPPVLRWLGVAPLDIASPIRGADLLYPRIGAHPDSIALTSADLTPAGSPAPLRLDAPIMSGYAEERD